MLTRLARRILVLMAVAASVLVAARSLRLRAEATAPLPSDPWPRLPDDDDIHWVEPEGGACPASHPVKVKLSSGLIHAPGMLAYQRTRADRCYPSAVSAEADGFKLAKL